MSFLIHQSENNDDNVASYASYCSARLGVVDRKTRKMPPAFPEIEVKKVQYIIRIYKQNYITAKQLYFDSCIFWGRNMAS